MANHRTIKPLASAPHGSTLSTTDPRRTATPGVRVDLATTAELFAALSDPSRLRILSILAQGETCVCDIIPPIGLAPSTISKHLELLRRAGLIAARKEGRWIHYRLTKPSPFPTATLKWLLAQVGATTEGAADQVQCCGSGDGQKLCGPTACATPAAAPTAKPRVTSKKVTP